MSATGPIVTTILAAIFLNFLTHRWQNRQKLMEIRTGLVGEISEAVMEIVMVIQFIRLDHNPSNHKDFDEAYKSWEVRSAVIGTKLEAYFGGTTIPNDWSDFSHLLWMFYALEGVSEGEREKQEQSFREKLAIFVPSAHVEPAWGSLKDGLLVRKAEIIRAILKAPMPRMGPS